jgi:hypothetical protein
MNSSKLAEKLHEEISKVLHPDQKVPVFLSELLNIDKEATYRRLRGEVPFSLYEAIIISKRLGISLDSLAGSVYNRNLAFELKAHSYYELDKEDYRMFGEFLNNLKEISKQPHSELAASYNVFPQLPSHIFYLLAKYNSFKWMYQHRNKYEIKCFHEINFPDDLFEMHRDSAYETMKIKETCYIWDNKIFESIVEEIKYFNEIYLINEEDVQALKDELGKLLDFLEEIATKGKFSTGNKVDIYISNINTDTAYSYITTGHQNMSMIGAFVLNYVISFEEGALVLIKEKINSLKRVSTLISGSGEKYRKSFFQEQRNIVSTL